MEATSNEKISEALKLLEEAARDKKEELRHMMANKYANLKTAVIDAEHTVADTFSAAQKRTVEALKVAQEVGTKKVKEAAVAVDEHVHENPWPYIGGAALAAFLFGYILGRKK